MKKDKRKSLDQEFDIRHEGDYFIPFKKHSPSINMLTGNNYRAININERSKHKIGDTNVLQDIRRAQYF